MLTSKTIKTPTHNIVNSSKVNKTPSRERMWNGGQGRNGDGSVRM